MADMILVETNTASTVKKEVTETQTLSAGQKVKMEIQDAELNETVPEGKVWYVVANVRIMETDA